MTGRKSWQTCFSFRHFLYSISLIFFLLKGIYEELLVLIFSLVFSYNFSLFCTRNSHNLDFHEHIPSHKLYKLSSDELYLSHTQLYREYNEEWNVFSTFNPSKCTHLEQWAADCAAPREQLWTSCRSRDSNPQPWVTSGFKSNALYIRLTTPLSET